MRKNYADIAEEVLEQTGGDPRALYQIWSNAFDPFDHLPVCLMCVSQVAATVRNEAMRPGELSDIIVLGGDFPAFAAAVGPEILEKLRADVRIPSNPHATKEISPDSVPAFAEYQTAFREKLGVE